jgi:hypothetical protein
LKDFGVKNKIINYDEQTKFLAEEKELNETNYFKELSNNEASKRAVARLEDKLENRDILLKNNEELNKLRKIIYTITKSTSYHQRKKIC